jgi:hypothetical protein
MSRFAQVKQFRQDIEVEDGKLGCRCGLNGKDEVCVQELIGKTFRVLVWHAERDDDILRWLRTKIKDISNIHIYSSYQICYVIEINLVTSEVGHVGRTGSLLLSRFRLCTNASSSLKR